MRLSTKLLLGLMATSSLVLGVNGVLQYRVEKAELETVAFHQLRLLSSAVQVAIENALRDRQQEDIHEVLDSLEVWDEGLDVFVFDATGARVAQSPGAMGPLRAGSNRAPEMASVAFHGDLEFLEARVPMFADEGHRLGHVVLVRPLGELRDELRREATALAISVLSLLLALGGVGALLIFVLVHRPLSHLRSAMEAVRGGDLSAQLEPASDDELGEVTGRFNEMVRALEEARARLAEESELREAMVAGLQRVDKLAAVGQLSAGLAHEIGSPLQILSGRAQVIADRADLPEDVRRNGQILVEQTARITRIVEQLLGFARRTPRSMAAVDLNAAVAKVVELVGTEARRRRVHLDMHLAPDLPRAHADEGQVQQIVLNLLTNAMRASGEDGRIRVELGRAPFTPRSGPPEIDGLVLSVRDEGRGIPASQLSQLFEPFFVGSTEAGNDTPGTGLGLSVVQAIVREHRGHIEVSSEPGQGTTFRVYFRERSESDAHAFEGARA